MKVAPSRTASRVAAGLVPLVLVAALIPLLAPTCGGFQAGVKTFAKGSIIIPMDVCYQCTTDNDNASDPASCGVGGYVTAAGTTPDGMGGGKACPQATDAGDVVKAYGLAYQLIRNGISVYWVIQDSPAKANLDDYDLTIQYGGGAPVQFYNWNSGGTLATPVPTSASTVNYMGGVFVVDGSDFAAANLVLQDGARIDKAIFSPVNLHVTNVAFQGYVKRTMAGGWDAGLTKIPKLGLLDIASSGSGTKNSYVVIAGYLQKAGLTNNIATPWPLGGTTADGNHGQIYDRLTMEDFLPRDTGGNYVAGGAWTTSTFYKNTIWGRRAVDPLATDGYSALWVPHWVAPNSCETCTRNGTPISCSDCGSSCSCTAYSGATGQGKINDALRVIGAFQVQGGDLFAECAGLGSFDGVPGDMYTPTWVNQSFTHFQTDTSPGPAGFVITTGTPGAPNFLGSFSLPLMQIGDFEFVPRSGAIATYHADDYKTQGAADGQLLRLVSEVPETATKDIFTMLVGVQGGSGSVVYMGGHSYSGQDQSYGTAGTRFVLNTLFNLGATCIANGASCSTGLFGRCATGAMTCSAGAPVCTPSYTPGQLTEVCNGLDDDCDGQVDEGLSQLCYTGPTGTSGNPLCHGGTRLCEQLGDGTFGYGTCLGQVLPATEICDNADNDCDGTVDDGIGDRACYTGPSTSKDPVTGLPMGICKSGTQSCSAGTWGFGTAPFVVGACNGQITPKPREVCGLADDPIGPGNGLDDNCNGLVDEGCGCTAGTLRPCYTGPADTYTVDVGGNITPKGDCSVGSQTCVSGAWEACAGQVLPATEENCGVLTETPPRDGDADCNGVNASAEPGCQYCYAQSCYEGPAGTLYGLCQTGTRTVCTDGTVGVCGGTQVLPAPEVCDGKDNDCDNAVDEGVNCGTGLSCVNGNCVRSVCGGELRCPTGYECSSATWTCVAITDCCRGEAVTAGGVCCSVALNVAGNCPGATAPRATCDSGDRCVKDLCDDPCVPNPCGPGTVCAGGICTGGACYTTGCSTGLVCRSGACVPDTCTGIACPSGTFCREGDCVQACSLVSCLEGQVCGVDGFCQNDACHGVTCNPGQLCVPDLVTGGFDCVANACTGILCGTGKICDEGTCVDDPCVAVQCPTGVCLPRPAIDCATPPCLRAQCFSTSNLTGGGTITEPKDDKTGCGCDTGQVSPTALLAGLLLLPLARRRRRLRGADGGTGLLGLLVVVGLAGALAGCGPKDDKKETIDCGTGGCNPSSLVAPFVGSISPGSGLKGSPKPVDVQISGVRFQNGATVRIFPTGEAAVTSVTWVSAEQLTARLDLSAAMFDGYLLRVVNPDRVISNLGTFTAVPMAPTVTGLTPDTVTAPTVVDLTVTGSNFTPASECWVKVGGYSLSLPARLFDSTKDDKLVCTLDTSRVSAGATTLWVVNETGLASTTRPLTVNGQLSLTAVSPPTVLMSTVAAPVVVVLTLYGGGFDNTCVVNVDGVARTTVFVDPTRLTATFTAPFVAGAYDVTVTKVGATSAGPVTLTVATGASVNQLSSLAPQTALQGSTTVFTFSGAGNLGGSTVQFLPPGGSFQDCGVVTGTGISVTRSMDFSATSTSCPTITSWPAGEYQVRLKFADLSVSGTFPFTLLSNVPTLWIFSTVPASTPLQQGTTVNLTVSGTYFLPGVELTLLGPGGFSRDATIEVLQVGPPPYVTGMIALTSMDTGVYSLVAKNTTSANSNPLTFNVLPGQPTLTSITPVPGTTAPACVQQGASLVTITLAGTNFAKPDALGAGGSIVLVQNQGLNIPANPDITPPIDPLQQPWMAIPSNTVTVVNNTTIQISFDTSTAVVSDAYPTGYNPAVCLVDMPCRCTSAAPCPYKVKVLNPGTTTLESVSRDLYVKLTACP